MTATLQVFPDRQSTYNWPLNCGNAVLILTTIAHQVRSHIRWMDVAFCGPSLPENDETHLFGLLLLTECEPDSRGVLRSVVAGGGGVTLSTQVTAWGFQTEPAGHSTGSALACSAPTMFANAANSKTKRVVPARLSKFSSPFP